MIELVLVLVKDKGVADEARLKNYFDYCDDLAGVERNIEKTLAFFGVFKESLQRTLKQTRLFSRTRKEVCCAVEHGRHC